MKFIRTKDGRIIDVSLFDEYQTNNEKDESVFDGFGNGRVYFPAEDILKQSDSIEELCDLFAFEDEFDEKHLAPEFFSSMALARLWAKKMNKSIIGYIIVEKNGAKAIEPVAKTNKKRKFELL